jgi:hypothetical protein
MQFHLGARASVVGSEHHNPRSGIREFLPAGLEAILKKFDVTTTTVAALLVLDLILNDEGFVLEVDRGGKRCRDSVVSGLGLGNKALVSLNEGRLRFLNLPFADVGEYLTADWCLLSCLRRCPAFRIVVGELLNERSFNLCCLQIEDQLL